MTTKIHLLETMHILTQGDVRGERIVNSKTVLYKIQNPTTPEDITFQFWGSILITVIHLEPRLYNIYSKEVEHILHIKLWRKNMGWFLTKWKHILYPACTNQLLIWSFGLLKFNNQLGLLISSGCQKKSETCQLSWKYFKFYLGESKHWNKEIFQINKQTTIYLLTTIRISMVQRK